MLQHKVSNSEGDKNSFCQTAEELSEELLDFGYDPWENTSRQPARCQGCGASFHTDDPTKHGYIPSETYESFSGGRKKILKIPNGTEVNHVPDGVNVIKNTSRKFVHRTRLMQCQRCYRLQQYKRLSIAEEAGEGEARVTTQHPYEVIESIVKRVKKGSLVLNIIDILDLESTMIPECFEALRNKQLDVLFLVNKIDALPARKCLPRIKAWVRNMTKQMKNVNSMDVLLISSKTEEGFAELEERLREHLRPSEPKWIYVVGRTNVGKSMFVTRWLRYIGFEHLGFCDFKRNIGGVTRSAVPGTTVNFVSWGLNKNFNLQNFKYLKYHNISKKQKNQP